MLQRACLIVAAAAVAACGPSPVAHDDDARLTLAPDSVIVEVFRTSVLTPTVRDANGAVQSGVALQYASRDERVVEVTAGGEIRAVAAGSTYVVATVSDRPHVRDSVPVRVYADSCSGVRPDFGGPATAADRALFAYDVNAPLNLQKTVESTNNGVEVSRISFSSPDGGSVAGMIWDPVTRSGPRPALVVLHGLPGSAKDMAGHGQAYAQKGAVVIAIDAPWNRRSPPDPYTWTPRDRDEQIQVIKDLQRAVDILRAHPRVDASRIGFVGVSWGGATGALFVGIERRLRTAVLVVGHGGQVSLHTGPPNGRIIRTLGCATGLAWIRAMVPVEPIRYVGNANVPLLMQNGRSDASIRNADAEALHAAAPQPKEVRWYDSGHNLPIAARVDAERWLAEHIGTDP